MGREGFIGLLAFVTTTSLAEDQRTLHPSLYWSRVDEMAQKDDWELVSQSEIHRRLRCVTCDGDVVLTFSVNVPTKDSEPRFTLSEAIDTYRKDRAERCSDFVVNRTGRCISTQPAKHRVKGFHTITELKQDIVEYEAVYFVYGGFIWADITGPRNSVFLGEIGRNLPFHLSGITPFY